MNYVESNASCPVNKNNITALIEEIKEKQDEKDLCFQHKVAKKRKQKKSQGLVHDKVHKKD